MQDYQAFLPLQTGQVTIVADVSDNVSLDSIIRTIRHHFTGVAQYYVTIGNASKQAMVILSADSDEINTCPGIVMPFQPNGSTMMNIRIKFHCDVILSAVLLSRFSNHFFRHNPPP